MDLTWRTEKRKIKDLKLFDGNPRKMSDKQAEQLLESLKKFNYVELIAIDQNNRVIAGNMRVQALKKLGRDDEEIEVRVPSRPLTEEEAREYLLRSNKNTGEWDYDLLANFSEEELNRVGFESEELDKIFDLDLGEKEDEVPEPRKETNIKYGDIFQLGNHRVMCGDATKKEDVEKLMNGEKADMVFTDPPYNVNYKGSVSTFRRGKTRSPILNDNLGADFIDFLRSVISNMMEICDGAFYICMSSKELGNLKKVFEELGGHWQSFIVWVKNHFTLSRADYQQLYEPIMYGWKGNHYFIQDRNKGNVWEDLSKVKTEYDGEYTTISFQGFQVRIKGRVEGGQVIRKHQKVDIWRCDKPIKSEEHPTMKPVALCEEAIRNSSKRGDIVLDVFGGSGSTLIACEKLNRRCYMMEIEPIYCQVIIDRWEQFTGQKAIKLN